MIDELVNLLQPTYGDRIVDSLTIRPYPYATSFALHEVHVEFVGRGTDELILKDFAREHMLADARGSRPTFLDDPRREIETHRRILTPEGVGPRCQAAVADPSVPRFWLVSEKVPGVELWQIGDLDVWEAAFEWLARFHDSFGSRVGQIEAANPLLFHHDGDWFHLWAERARHALRESLDPRAVALHDALDGYGAVADRLAALPATLVHGELYPSNVMVVQRDGDVRVCPVDWEMAALGPALIDVAALLSGWDAAPAARLMSAYGAVAADDLDRCRLHLALQWIGWARCWNPPRDHARDWLGDALELAREVLR